MTDNFSEKSVAELIDILAEKTLAMIKLIEQKKTNSQHFIMLKRDVQLLQTMIKKIKKPNISNA